MKISYSEYKRLTFNNLMNTCLSTLHECIVSDAIDSGVVNIDSEKIHRSSENTNRELCEAFFGDMVGFNTNTLDDTKQFFKYGTPEINSFIRDCIDLSESIADDKVAALADAKMSASDDKQAVALSKDDYKEIDTLFSEKAPIPEIDAIRNATASALAEERKRAEEIKAANDMASLVPEDNQEGETKALKEAVTALIANRPKSLFNAILTRVSSSAITAISETTGLNKPIGSIMQNNREEIVNRSISVYALYEMAHCFGIHVYTNSEVNDIASEIYYNIKK